MKYIELTLEEADMLHQVLERSLAELELEIQHTDRKEFKNLLKQRSAVLRGVVSKLEQPDPASIGSVSYR